MAVKEKDSLFGDEADVPEEDSPSVPDFDSPPEPDMPEGPDGRDDFVPASAMPVASPLPLESSGPPASESAGLTPTLVRPGQSSASAIEVLQLGSSGSYEVLRPLGKGGMAEVVLARRVGMGDFRRDVAIKRIRGFLNEDPEFVKLFAQEAQLAARLHHTNIASVYDFQSDADTFFIVMEYVPGMSLRDILSLAQRKGGSLSEPFACFVAQQLAAALQYAHHAKNDDGKPLCIVHRDVSPHNVMVSDSGSVKLLDFGVAFSATEGRERTRSGVLKGKFAYMSPEQADGAPLDGRSDLFSLGLVFAEMLTGRRIFEGPSETSTLKRVSEAAEADVDAATRLLPGALQAVLRKMFAKDPSRRFDTCGDFGKALRDYLKVAGPWFGPEDASAELALLTSLPDNADGTASQKPRARGAVATPPATPTPAPVAAPPPLQEPPAQRQEAPGRVGATTPEAGPPPAVLPPPGATQAPSAAGASPALAPVSSETQVRRRAKMREELLNPQGATRKALVLPVVAILVCLLGGIALVKVLEALKPEGQGGAEHAEVVKTPEQERAADEAEQKALAPEASMVELAPQDDRPVRASPPPPVAVAAPAAKVAHKAGGSRGGHPTAAVRAAAPAEASHWRDLDSSTVTQYSVPAVPVGGAPGPKLPKTTLIAVKLLSPADANNPGPVLVSVTKDVAVAGSVVVPKGTQLNCTSQSTVSGRVGVTCDALVIGSQEHAFQGSALGRDHLPGIPVRTPGGEGPDDNADDVKGATIDTAAQLASSVLGTSTAGGVANTAVGVGADRSRRSGSGSTRSEVASSPAPKGTAFFIRVEQGF